MTTLKLKVSKSKRINPLTKQMGFAARVLTNGTAYFDDIVKDAGRNTTMHKAELRMAFELCMDSVSEMLKQGYIVDLGPIGKIYPSCSSGWYAKEEDMMLADVKPQLYFCSGRPSHARNIQYVSGKRKVLERDDAVIYTTFKHGNGHDDSGSCICGGVKCYT